LPYYSLRKYIKPDVRETPGSTHKIQRAGENPLKESFEKFLDEAYSSRLNYLFI